MQTIFRFFYGTSWSPAVNSGQQGPWSYSCPNQWLTIPVSVPLSASVSYDSPEPCKPSPLDTNPHTNVALNLLSQSVAHKPCFYAPVRWRVIWLPRARLTLTTWHQSTHQCCSLYISCPNQQITIHVCVPLSAPVSYDSLEPCKLSPIDTNTHTNAAHLLTEL